jgi:hypothetical protein
MQASGRRFLGNQGVSQIHRPSDVGWHRVRHLWGNDRLLLRWEPEDIFRPQEQNGAATQQYGHEDAES